MFARRSFSCLLAALLLTAFAGAAESIIPNGNLETEAKKDPGWPDKWGHPKSGGTWEVENGNHFLRLKAAAPGQMTMFYQIYKIPAEARALELTWKQRITDLKAGRENYFDARILLDFKDAAGMKLKGPSAPYTRKNTNGWVERSLKFIVPPGAATLDFMPSLFQVERGTFDLDDLSLKAIPAEELIAAKAAQAEEDKKTMVPVEEPQPAKFPPPLHVAGNRLVDPSGKEVWLQGVNVVSLEWNPKGEQVMKAALTALQDWKANIFRLPVKESYWFGTEGPKDEGKEYRELVDHLIALAANRGAYVLLDLHRFHSPKAEHVDFWKDAAARYKDHPAVLFDIFNEPHGTSWEIWRNGGFIATKKKGADEDNFLTPEEKAKAANGFQGVGMQALVNAVRSTGAKNVIVAGGLDWAYDLSGITNGFALDEPGGNGIAYSTHIYPWKKGWKDKVVPAAEKYPILVGELGANTKKMSFIPASGQEDAATWVPAMLGFIQKYHLNWTGFSLHPKASPTMITGWDYTPTPEWGALAKRALAGEKFEMDRLR